MKKDNPQQADDLYIALVTNLAYVAGFFDGEGSAKIYVGSGINRKGIVFAVSIWQSDLAVLDWIKETFGGGVYARTNAGYGKNSSRSTAEWRVTGHAAYYFCQQIRPFLKVRCEKIDEVMWKWERRAVAETEWNDCPFDEKRTRQMRQSDLQGIAEPAEAGRND